MLTYKIRLIIHEGCGLHVHARLVWFGLVCVRDRVRAGEFRKLVVLTNRDVAPLRSNTDLCETVCEESPGLHMEKFQLCCYALFLPILPIFG